MNDDKKLQSLCEKCDAKCCRCHSSILISQDEDTTRLDELGADIIDDKGFGLVIACQDNVCQFLKDNKCSIYEDRPWACIEFDCRDPRRQDSIVFEDFPEHAKFLKDNA